MSLDQFLSAFFGAGSVLALSAFTFSRLVTQVDKIADKVEKIADKVSDLLVTNAETEMRLNGLDKLEDHAISTHDRLTRIETQLKIPKSPNH